MKELPKTTMVPIPKAIHLASRISSTSERGAAPEAPRKSRVTTAVIELTPESMLDMAAANIAGHDETGDAGRQMKGDVMREDLVRIRIDPNPRRQQVSVHIEVSQERKADQSQHDGHDGRHNKLRAQ
jgi:hypothetical protein